MKYVKIGLREKLYNRNKIDGVTMFLRKCYNSIEFYD